MLFIQPQYKMDPFITPPPIMEIYQKLQKEIASKTKEMEKAREQSSAANKAKTVVIEKVVTRRRVPSAAPFIPFGYAQFENDEPWKAAAFAFTQLGLLTGNIASYWAKKNYLVPGTNYLVATQEEQRQYEMLQNFQIGSAVMLGGVYLLGVIDGLLNYSKIRVENESKKKALKNNDLEPVSGE